MKRYYFTLVVSIFLILLGIYQLWKLQHPRTGPVGDGTISPWVYVPFVSSLLLGLIWFPRSLYRIIKGINRNNDRNDKGTPDE